MSPKRSKVQDSTKSNDQLRGGQSDLRRERARLAQQRSRARTRTELQSLTSRVQVLSTAVEEMTKIFLDLTNDALSRCDSFNNENDIRNIKNYMERYLDIVHGVTDNDVDDTEGAEEITRNTLTSLTSGEEAPDLVDEIIYDLSDPAGLLLAAPGSLSSTPFPHSTLQPIATPTSGSDETVAWSRTSYGMREQSLPQGQYSPRLNFGLLLPPLDLQAAPDLRGSTALRQPTFAAKLFWNALRFGYVLLASRLDIQAPIFDYKYHYAIQHDPRARIATRLRRGLACMPSNIPLYTTSLTLPEIPSPHCHPSVPSRSGISSNLRKPLVHPDDVNDELERVNMRESYHKIVESMHLEGEDVHDYLDARAVQTRLLNTWGIDATAESSKEDYYRSNLSAGSENLESSISITKTAPVSISNQQLQDDRSIAANLQSFQNVPTPIRQMWTAEAMVNLWSSFIIKLAMEGRCAGDKPLFPLKTVDEFAQGILLAGAA